GAAGYGAVPSLLYGQGRLRARRVPGPVLRGAVLRTQLAGPSGQLYPGQSDGDACAYRARMVFLAILRDPAGLHLRLLLRARKASGRVRDVRVDPAAVRAAMARHVAGPLGQLSPAVQEV